MKDDAGRVDDAPQRVALTPVDLFRDREVKSSEAMVQAGVRVLSLAYFPFDATEHGSCGANHGAVRFGLNDSGEAGIEQEIVERRQHAVQTAQFGIAHAVLSALHEPMAANKSVIALLP